MRPRAAGEWPVPRARAIDPGIDDALTEFIARRKRPMPDAWY